MNNSIITIEKANEEKFNSFDFSVDTIQKFMAYYMLLLEVACNLNMISTQQKERISQNLLFSIAKETNGKAILVANTLYVYTYWLLSMKPSDALKELENCDESLKKAKVHLKNFVSKNRLMLSTVKNKVMATNNEAIINSYNHFHELLVECEHCCESEDIVLKSVHTNVLPVVYIPLKEPERLNYFQQINDYIKIFSTEIGIMSKLRGAEFYNQLNAQADTLEKMSSSEMDALERQYNSQLEALKEEYDKKRKEALEREKSLTNCHFLSSDEIRAQYVMKQNLIRENWDKAEKKLLKKQEKAEEVNIISNEINIPGLYWLIREFALFSQAKCGLRKYPKRLKDRAKAIDSMDNQLAIREVLKIKDEIDLTEGEINYLLSII